MMLFEDVAQTGASKLHARHLDRLAVVYVRQSSPHQVLNHQESARLQYGLRARAAALGWPAERVVVIDEDQGTSAASAAGRRGFQRLVAEVSVDHVGLILGIEVSRLARSSVDQHQLLELCALFGTLIADAEGLYDPAQYNDRLLLGVKGTLSEAELHLIKQRLNQGRLSKARRGALVVPLPTGYVRRPSGEVTLDPDEQVQHVVRLIFRKFAELGTLNAVLRYLVAHNIQVGIRLREGPAKGEVEWRRPNRMTLQNLLKNPLYAGAYAQGRSQLDPRRKQPGRRGTGMVVRAVDEWLVLLKDQHPADISWTEYEQNRARLQANRARAAARGAVRLGPALLAGLVICARCGCRLVVRYGGPAQQAMDVCERRHADYGEARCQHLAGPCLDQFVSVQVLAALQPAALDLSLEAAQHLERDRDDLARLWQQRRERAAYEAERAARHYQQSEPENRLVARQLAREWEANLAAQQRLEEEYHRFVQTQPRLLSAPERAAIQQLAANIPALGAAPPTTVAERKEIIRQVVQRVVVAVHEDTERVQVSIAWVGGTETVGEVIRPVARLEQLSYYPQLCQRVRALVAEGRSAAAIAACLNAEGLRPPKRHLQFGAQGVRDLVLRLGARPLAARPRAQAMLAPDAWWLGELAHAVGMPPVTLYSWIKRGWVRARQLAAPPRQRWVVWADAGEQERLRRLHQRPAGAAAHDRWVHGAASGLGAAADAHDDQRV